MTTARYFAQDAKDEEERQTCLLAYRNFCLVSASHRVEQDKFKAEADP